MGSILSHLLLSLLVFFSTVQSQSIIKSLPGFAGDLPFKLETGYIGVGEFDDVQLFYYFIESERSPKDDPMMLWLTGGPGCSSLSGLIYEIGPLNFNYDNSSGNRPSFLLNPYSWTKVANIIFLDQPVGTGFSYSTTQEGYHTGDLSSAAETYQFLRKWLMVHPEFLSNPLYITGDSYSGMTIPIIVTEVVNGNEVGHLPPLNIKGYVLGNPLTDVLYDLNSRVVFAHRKALISDELYKSAKNNCKGEYMHVDPENVDCGVDLQSVVECVEKIFNAHVLEPKCSTSTPRPNFLKWDRRILEHGNSEINPLSLHEFPRPWCRNYDYLYCYVWANDETVQKALQIREGTKTEWIRCNESSSYAHDVLKSTDYHRNLTEKKLRALIYSGDHDMVVPYIGTMAWIETLNLSLSTDWEAWFVDGQVAGYTLQYEHDNYKLTYATVKGAGHTAPEYKPKETLAMIYRWFANYPL
ncbi:serine carboxypeptidase-like 2 [Syzygium oleosum]|uniref:serine carboxypeptidase-like 2 n=1 Tax=Syzygium oleosum TaxID=219896 RepID=UPI0024B9AF71|nr:serine carboxypeptidase-like 2 [Syzygium oleosum]